MKQLPVPVVLIVALAMASASRDTAAQAPSLPTVLDRASAYVTAFKHQFSGFVAEEDYIQDVSRRSPIRGQPTHRELRSDFLLVRPPELDRYVEFRDVFEVDGQSVRDREERLSKLFLDTDSATGQLQRIVEESARYNLSGTSGSAPVRRNINIPTLALLFLDPGYRSRFTFSRVEDRGFRAPSLAPPPDHPSAPLFFVSTEAWVIAYRERAEPTIIRTVDRHNLTARGRFWIEPSSGRVLMTELTTGAPGPRTEIDVTYRLDPELGMPVPVQMRERYEARDYVITGTATYLNFRRFAVNVVNEVIGPIVR